MDNLLSVRNGRLTVISFYDKEWDDLDDIAISKVIEVTELREYK